MDAIQKSLLEQVAELHDVPEGAYNIRANGKSAARNTTANIDIVSKTDKDGIDILINCAQGAMQYREINDVDEAYTLEAFESGPLASMMFMKACFPYLKESGHGRIINTASAAGYDGNAGFGAYGMAKEAIRAITRTAANEWGRYGITVNVFLPIIATDFFREPQAEALRNLESKTPLGYIGTTEKDCAPLIVLLVSDEGGYFTGQSYMVDGGIHKHS